MWKFSKGGTFMKKEQKKLTEMTTAGG